MTLELRAAPVITQVRCVEFAPRLDPPIVSPFGEMKYRRNLLAVVELDDGSVGYGEIWCNFPTWGSPDKVNLINHFLAPALIGQHLSSPIELSQQMARKCRGLANQTAAHGPVAHTLAGLDIAVWDAYAQHLRLPLRTAIRKGAPNFAEVYGTNLPVDRPDLVEPMFRLGHTRIKVKYRGSPDIVLPQLKEMRRAVGDAPLMTDASQTAKLDELRSAVPTLEKLELAWFEEPFPIDDLETYRAWNTSRGSVPLAMGENSYGSDGFEILDREIHPDVMQPDITKTLGISGGLEVGRKILDSGKLLALHMYGGPVGLAASANLAAALGGGTLVEMDSLSNQLYDVIGVDVLPVKNGRVQLSDEYGLGIKLKT